MVINLENARNEINRYSNLDKWERILPSENTAEAKTLLKECQENKILQNWLEENFEIQIEQGKSKLRKKTAAELAKTLQRAVTAAALFNPGAAILAVPAIIHKMEDISKTEARINFLNLVKGVMATSRNYLQSMIGQEMSMGTYLKTIQKKMNSLTLSQDIQTALTKKETKTMEKIQKTLGDVTLTELENAIKTMPEGPRKRTLTAMIRGVTERERALQALHKTLTPFQTTKPETKESLESQATTLIQHFTELDEKQRKEFFKQTFLPKEHERATRDYTALDTFGTTLYIKGSKKEAEIERELLTLEKKMSNEALIEQVMDAEKTPPTKLITRLERTKARHQARRLALAQQTELAKQKEMLAQAGAATELPAPTLITTTTQLKSLQRTTARLEGYIKKYGAATATQLITAIERVKPTPKISLLRQRTTTDLVREQVIAGLKKRKLETQRATYLEQVNEVLRQKNNAEQALENLKQLNARRKIKEERRALKQQKRPAQQARPTQTHTLTPQRRPSTVPPQQTPPTPLAPPKHAAPPSPAQVAQEHARQITLGLRPVPTPPLRMHENASRQARLLRIYHTPQAIARQRITTEKARCGHESLPYHNQSLIAEA